jgi:hypothetical protein
VTSAKAREPAVVLEAEELERGGESVRSDSSAPRRATHSRRRTAEAPEQAQPDLPAATVEPTPASQLAEEIAVLDRARGALAGGGAGQALDELAGYDRRFPRGTLRAEATVVRIEAHLELGQRARAQRLAETFAERNPKSALLQRVRALLAQARD